MSDDQELPAGWTAHVAPSGHNYYYRATTKKSTYQKPVKSAAQPSAERPGAYPDATSAPSSRTDSVTQRPIKRTRSTLPDGDVPVSRVDMPEAYPWCLVYTKRGRRFFHNRQSRVSAWNCPEDIESAYTRFLERSRRELLAEANQSDEEMLEDRGEQDFGTVDDPYESSNSDGDGVSDADQDSIQNSAIDPTLNGDNAADSADLDFEVDLAEQMLALADEAAHKVQDPHEGLSIDDRRSLFNQLLRNKGVSPFRTWEQELDKLIDDDRYLALTSTQQRKAVFEQYCADRIAETRAAEASTRQADPKAAFLALIAESTACQYFADFKRRHKREDAYKRFGASDHERERLFRAFRDAAKRPLAQRESDFHVLLSENVEQPEADLRYHVLKNYERDALQLRRS